MAKIYYFQTERMMRGLTPVAVLVNKPQTDWERIISAMRSLFIREVARQRNHVGRVVPISVDEYPKTDIPVSGRWPRINS